MSDEIKNAVRQHLEPLLAAQDRHPVHPLVEVLWSEPHDLAGCMMRLGSIIERVPPEVVVRRVMQRKHLITKERSDPLRYLCEPDEYRHIDQEVVNKRLRHPGVPLTLWVSGGIRSSKTEFCTRRVSANFWFTENAWCWGFHETDTTSREIQQARVKRFLPPEMDPDSGKYKKDKTTKFSYSEGTGFTGSEFNIYWDASDEEGVKHRYGGRFGFRFYGQDPGTMVGQELTCATSDELIPPKVLKLVYDRLLTRAEDTARPEFMRRMLAAKAILERGEALPLPLLGAIYHGWHIISFTPKEGWTATCSSFLQGAVKYSHYDPRPWVQIAMQKAVAAQPTPELQREKATELEQKPWTLGSITQVPRFAQPGDALKLVAYLPTFANQFKGNWPGAVEGNQNRSNEDILITLFGDVDKNWQSEFSGYDEKRHVREWKDFPRDGTIYEVGDPAGAKPNAFAWLLADGCGRHWLLQEWPCTSWEIEGHGKPGLWAVPSENENRNGDKGPAQKMRLKGWNRSRYTRLMWEGRKRILEKMAETGEPWRGRIFSKELTWKERADWKLAGPFVEVEWSKMDRRYSSNKTERDQEVMSILEAWNLEENAIGWDEAPTDRIAIGDDLIRNALEDEIEGMAGLIVNTECVNARFTLATYTLPEYSERTKAWDEACKESRDLLAMYLESSPEHVDRRNLRPDDGRR